MSCRAGEGFEEGKLERVRGIIQVLGRDTNVSKGNVGGEGEDWAVCVGRVGLSQLVQLARGTWPPPGWSLENRGALEIRKECLRGETQRMPNGMYEG